MKRPNIEEIEARAAKAIEVGCGSSYVEDVPDLIAYVKYLEQQRTAAKQFIIAGKANYEGCSTAREDYEEILTVLEDL